MNRMHPEDLDAAARAVAQRWADHFDKEIRQRIAGLLRADLLARAEKAEAERDKWARNYETKRLEWGRNLEKWNGIIKSGLTWDQPELPIFIDSALKQGVEDAAHLAAIDAAAAKLPEMPILIRHGPASYEKTSVDALGAHAALLRSTAAAAIQERDALQVRVGEMETELRNVTDPDPALMKEVEAYIDAEHPFIVEGMNGKPGLFVETWLLVELIKRRVRHRRLKMSVRQENRYRKLVISQGRIASDRQREVEAACMVRGLRMPAIPPPPSARRRDVRLWMRHNAEHYETATGLAEAANAVFRLPDGGLDDETHWVWDEACEAMGDA